MLVWWVCAEKRGTKARIWMGAGLGNPGREYQRTRHKAGVCLVETLARKWARNFNSVKKFFGEVCRLDGDAWMVKPMTFMNRSGQAVAARCGVGAAERNWGGANWTDLSVAGKG